ncbi:hypothetical protein HQQ80_03855 [Microbacteriaceae bacterium VKM Ac-2855]|nr:hypothetical protein [Microbacteriaceae bacterium VKM Ac-2855]
MTSNRASVRLTPSGVQSADARAEMMMMRMLPDRNGYALVRGCSCPLS